ncbi:hypothetical protein F7Q99_39695 [Streptomyces kaniharaensis]|uniref:Peptidase inhibitor family I36 protein n=1 Tax=Streptomyces kaniharaensis TaxID=212423 RepID=A0A6N7KYM5_9ACTN|nr:hypothetical protein [Streptomyces kaniharaensis]MQS16786.1 hypothetical protein [Streptomyces kaniharaensis]MQS18147.1 hypothetical protein [Streptomyces kaniharaensis]
MRGLVRAVAVVGLAVGVVAGVGVGGAGAVGGSWAGCPWGAVCVYPQGQDPAVSPSEVFWSYGAHNLSNQFGSHWVLNNQSGGAHARLCRGSGGVDCVYDMAAQNGVWFDLGPVNSITLDRP